MKKHANLILALALLLAASWQAVRAGITTAVIPQVIPTGFFVGGKAKFSTTDSSGNITTPGGISVGQGTATTGYWESIGKTSGGVGWAGQDAAGGPLLYILPNAAGGSGKVLSDSGSVGCPSLPAGAPGTCEGTAWITPAAGGTGGGGYPGYSANVLTATLTGTIFFPVVGGVQPSGTEANVQSAAPYAATGNDFYVSLSAAPGVGNSIAFTIDDNGSATAVTCTISGGAATSCNDTTHTFTGVAGDLLSIKAVCTGTPATANFNITFNYGGSGSSASVSPPYLTVSGTTYGPVYAITAPPAIGSFTAINTGGATLTNYNGAIFAQTTSNSTNVRLWELALPARPWSINAGIIPSTYGAMNFMQEGINVCDSGCSASTKIVTFGFVAGAIRVDHWNNATSFSGTAFTVAATVGPIFLKLRDDGTNFTYSTSKDGVNFQQVFQESRTAWLTTPSDYGFNLDASSTTINPAMLLLSWLVGT